MVAERPPARDHDADGVFQGVGQHAPSFRDARLCADPDPEVGRAWLDSGFARVRARAPGMTMDYSAALLNFARQAVTVRNGSPERDCFGHPPAEVQN